MLLAGSPAMVVGDYATQMDLADCRAAEGSPECVEQQCAAKGSPTESTTDDSPAYDPEDLDDDSDDSECGGNRFSAEETFIIFDWDDTMLPSSWVQEQGLRLDRDLELSTQQQEELGELARQVAETFRLAKQFGTVVLVTNAERGWIELSCQRYMPSLYPSLKDVKLLSARSEYECPDSTPFEWKLMAFQSELGRIFAPDETGSRRKNVLSFGDSVHEREALIHGTASILNCRTKSLKFTERPGIGQLRKQHTLVARCFHRIVHHDGNLDLHIRAL